MDGYGLIANLKIQSAEDRAQALALEVDRAQNRIYSSPGSQRVLTFVREAAQAILGLLEQEKAVVGSNLLTPSETDVRLHRLTKVIPFLHLLIGLVEGSDVNRSPGQLIQPLRRYIRSVIPTAELVVSSKPELNYSIQEIVVSIKNVFSGTPLEPSCKNLPEFLFIVNIPAVESEQILIHGILSHELGHALYNKHGVADRLLPKINLREDMIRSLIASMPAGSKDQELWVRQRLTDQVTQRVSAWVMELSSDAIGIWLFGPGLFLASVHLLSSFSHIDQCTSTHPPTRLRVKLMSRILKEHYKVDQWHPELQKFLRAWDELSNEQLVARLPIDQIAIESLNTDDVLKLVCDETLSAVGGRRYTNDRFSTDIQTLVPFLVNVIPPGETGSLEKSIPTDLVSIINAGWYVYICEFQQFRTKLHDSDSSDRLASSMKLHKLVLKALEISEIKIAWEEATNVVRRGEDQGATQQSTS